MVDELENSVRRVAVVGAGARARGGIETGVPWRIGALQPAAVG